MITIQEFSGRTAFVTGAGTGIGAATAIELAARGAQVALFGRRTPALERTAATIAQAGGDAIALTGNVANARDVERAVQQTLTTYGSLHMAVNNAGVDGGTQRL